MGLRKLCGESQPMGCFWGRSQSMGCHHSVSEPAFLWPKEVLFLYVCNVSISTTGVRRSLFHVK